jgi:hypothetical protein
VAATVKAQERLFAGQRDASEGRHAEALEQFEWFHDHALEEEPSLYGVRLSFALAFWKELGDKYPKARTALRRRRDAKTKLLLNGKGDRSLFHDVVALNQTLGETAKTYRLYLRLSRANPELALSCAVLALPAVVEAGDFKQAEQMTPDPSKRVERLCADLNQAIEWQLNDPRKAQIATRRALVHNHVEDVTLLLALLDGRGRAAEALEVKRLASSLVSSLSVRRAVRARFAAVGRG